MTPRFYKITENCFVFQLLCGLLLQLPDSSSINDDFDMEILLQLFAIGKHMGYISLYKRPAFFFVDVKYHVHISTSFSWLLVFMLIVRYLAYTCKQETCRVLQML